MGKVRPRLDLSIFGVPREDPGYIYVIQNHGRFKIGKCKTVSLRLKAARTWLPDMTVLGHKPFWNVSNIERELHTGFSLHWYAGEWFEFAEEYDRQILISGFLEFSDSDRDTNSVDFIYWFNSEGIAEYVIERQQQGLTLPKFLRRESSSKKG